MSEQEPRAIGPIKKGGFHRWLGKKEDEPITAEDIAKGLASDDPHVKKMAQFAKSAKKFNSAADEILPFPAEPKALQVGDDVEGRDALDGDGPDSEPDGDECPTCEGTGMSNGEQCPDCDGTGKADATESVGGQNQNAASPELEQRKARLEILDGTVERRDFGAEMEIREASDGTLRLTGYASTTETPYEVSDFTETIARGAFKRTLADEPDVVLLVNHEGIPLARTKSGTLTLSEDVRGLRVDADLDASNPIVESLRSPMERGDLTEMSFAFRATQQDWSEDYTKRTIREVTIHRGDVSMVTHGANSATLGTLSRRSAEGEDEIPAKRPARPQASYIENVKAKRAHHRRPR